MRTAVIAVLIAGLLAGPVAAQVSGPVLVQPPSWQKKPSLKKAMAAEDAKVRGRAAYLAGRTPEALVADVRAAHPSGGDEIVATALKEARTTGKAEVDLLKGDGLSELGETEQLRLQAAMDRLSKFEQTLSNILKKMSDTQNAITQNLK